MEWRRQYRRLLLITYRHEKLLLTITLTLSAVTLAAQNTPKTTQQTSVAACDSLIRYRLYPTQNMWTFLKLDTRAGRI